MITRLIIFGLPAFILCGLAEALDRISFGHVGATVVGNAATWLLIGEWPND